MTPLLFFAAVCAVYDCAYLTHCLKTGQRSAAAGAFLLAAASVAAAAFFVR